MGQGRVTSPELHTVRIYILFGFRGHKEIRITGTQLQHDFAEIQNIPLPDVRSLAVAADPFLVACVQHEAGEPRIVVIINENISAHYIAMGYSAVMQLENCVRYLCDPFET